MGAVRRLPDLSLLLRARRFFLWAVSGFSLPGAAAKKLPESSHRRGFDLPCRALSPSKLNAPKKEGGSETGRHKEGLQNTDLFQRAGNKKTLCEWVPHSHRVFVCPFYKFSPPAECGCHRRWQSGVWRYPIASISECLHFLPIFLETDFEKEISS